MAIYSFNVSPIQRSKAQSAVARAAYIGRTSIFDQRLGYSFNYTRTKSDIEILPSRIPGREIETSDLWNLAELAEKRCNSCTGRAVIFALPVETSRAENKIIAENFRQWLEHTYKVGTSLALHYDHQNNPHGHLLFTSRQIELDGQFGQKLREMDSRKTGPQEITRMRQAWEKIANETLAAHGKRIDCRTLKAQGIDRQPGHHMGIKGHYARRMAKKEVINGLDQAVDNQAELIKAELELGNIDNELAVINQKFDKLRAYNAKILREQTGKAGKGNKTATRNGMSGIDAKQGNTRKAAMDIERPVLGTDTTGSHQGIANNGGNYITKTDQSSRTGNVTDKSGCNSNGAIQKGICKADRGLVSMDRGTNNGSTGRPQPGKESSLARATGASGLSGGSARQDMAKAREFEQTLAEIGEKYAIKAAKIPIQQISGPALLSWNFKSMGKRIFEAINKVFEQDALDFLHKRQSHEQRKDNAIGLDESGKGGMGITRSGEKSGQEIKKLHAPRV